MPPAPVTPFVSIEPLILYVPGLKPKPPPGIHVDALLRCLVEGVRRVDPEIAAQIRDSGNAFDIVGWNFDFYGEHRNFELDRDGIARVLERQQATPEDKAGATTLKRRLVQWMYRLADRLPFLIPQVADENLQLHLRDLRRYVKNEDDIATATRRLLKLPLRAAERNRRPTLVIGHSMGSIIAYDTLWELSRESGSGLRIDLMTMGSPLGERTIQQRLLGARHTGRERYPGVVRRWVNIAAVGELTAIDMTLRDDYAEMIELGLIEDIEDFSIYNTFRQNGVLNVHAEYGYLVNEVTGRQVCDWWRRTSSPNRDSA